MKPGGLTDKLLGDYANMYADLSAGSGLNAITRDQEFYRGFIARHSAKLLWGSDCDCHDGKGGGIRSGFCLAEQSLALLRKLAPDAATYRRIIYGNAAKLLKLKQTSSGKGGRGLKCKTQRRDALLRDTPDGKHPGQRPRTDLCGNRLSLAFASRD